MWSTCFRLGCYASNEGVRLGGVKRDRAFRHNEGAGQGRAPEQTMNFIRSSQMSDLLSFMIIRVICMVGTWWRRPCDGV